MFYKAHITICDYMFMCVNICLKINIPNSTVSTLRCNSDCCTQCFRTSALSKWVFDNICWINGYVLLGEIFIF